MKKRANPLEVWRSIDLANLFPEPVFTEGFPRWDEWQLLTADNEDRQGAENLITDWLWPLPSEYEHDPAHLELLNKSPFDVHLMYHEERDEYALNVTPGATPGEHWNIAGAYLLLGFLPPVCLRLDGVPGEPARMVAVTILDAMAKSCEFMQGRAKARAEQFAHTRRAYYEEPKGR